MDKKCSLCSSIMTFTRGRPPKFCVNCKKIGRSLQRRKNTQCLVCKKPLRYFSIDEGMNEKKYCKDCRYDGYRLSFYGLTMNEYNQLFESQERRCAICRTDDFGGKSPSVDHDHKTKKVRGLLCVRCNFLLGFSKDNPVILEKAIRYLHSNSIYA